MPEHIGITDGGGVGHAGAATGKPLTSWQMIHNAPLQNITDGASL
jgi:hypothetical protein